MPKVLIIGDDLTGVNSSAVLLARRGMRCATFYELSDYSKEEHAFLDTVVISTDSRSVSPEIAYERVKEAMEATYADDVRFINKRIDSTLRGNIGSELQAIREHLSPDTLVLIVPVFPSSGRVVIGGYMMVNQVPLEKTDVAKDPKNPILTSNVLAILQSQIPDKIEFIEIGQVLKGVDHLKDLILSKYENGCRVVVTDAVTDDDVSMVAKAATATGIPLIAVDPGPLTYELSRELVHVAPTGKGQKVMVTVGSVSDQTRRQLNNLRFAYPNKLVKVESEKLIDNDVRSMEIARIVSELSGDIDEYQVVGVVTSETANDVLDMKKTSAKYGINMDEASKRISEGLAEITRRVIERQESIGGLFASGGDVAVAVSSALNAAYFEVKDQIIPLAVYGRLRQGLFDGRPMVTKGGLIGDDNAISLCTSYLLTKISNELYQK